MEQFWRLGPASVREIQESLAEKDRPAYTTVQTMVYRLEEKKAVRRVKKAIIERAPENTWHASFDRTRTFDKEWCRRISERSGKETHRCEDK